MHITLTTLLDTLDLVKGQQAVRKGVLGARRRRRADDGTTRRRQRRRRRETVVIRAHETGIQRHQRAGLHNDRWFGGGGGGSGLAGWVGRDWGLGWRRSHVHSTPEGIGGGHLVHVHDG